MENEGVGMLCPVSTDEKSKERAAFPGLQKAQSLGPDSENHPAWFAEIPDSGGGKGCLGKGEV